MRIASFQNCTENGKILSCFSRIGVVESMAECENHWLVSNFFPMNSKKFEFRDFDSIIRFAIENESEIEKLRSRDRQIFLKIRFYVINAIGLAHLIQHTYRIYVIMR